MISIRKAATELDRLDDLKRAAIGCYGLAIHSTGEFAIEVSEGQARQFRESLLLLEQQCRDAATAEQLEGVQSSFRHELEAHKSTVEDQIRKLRKDVEAAAAAVEAFAGNVVTNGSHYEVEMKRELLRLNTVAAQDDLHEIRAAIRNATAAIAAGFEHLRSVNQLAIAQLKDEIRVLHQQIQAERRTRTAVVTQAAGRGREIGGRVEELLQQSLSFPALVVVIRNLAPLESKYPPSVIDLALNSLTMRLRGILGDRTRFGRWGKEQFLAILDTAPDSAIGISRQVADQLSKTYILQDKGLTHTVSLQVRAGVVDHRAEGDPAKFYARVDRLAETLANA